MSARREAYAAFFDITERGAYANLRLKKIGAHDAGFVSALVYTALEKLVTIDYYIAHFTGGKRVKPQVKAVLRLGICELLYMDTPANAAVNEYVNLTKAIGKAPLAGFVNALQRSVDRSRASLPKPQGGSELLSVEYGWPKWIVDMWLERYDEAFVKAMLEGGTCRGVTLRAQPPLDAEGLAAWLNKNQLKFSRGTLEPNAFHVENGAEALRSDLFAQGRVAVQSEGAMAVCRAAAVRDGMCVLDCCAAPGGKTAYLYALAPGAQFEAWDVHEHRVKLMEATFARLGVKAAARVADASVDAPELHEAFDVVLVDAPCSGLGVAFSKPDIRHALKRADITALSALQREILDTVSEYVKPGGALVYATCTIAREENEDNADWFEKNHPEFLPDAISPYVAAETGKNRVQLFPHLHGGEGFFIARYRKA
jgi:16S rRNA (cytosine967-C5)-methyltransferase